MNDLAQEEEQLEGLVTYVEAHLVGEDREEVWTIALESARDRKLEPPHIWAQKVLDAMGY